MPLTAKLDTKHSVTITSARRRYGHWEAQGDIFFTASSKDIGITVYADGETMVQAESRAVAAARNRCLKQ